MMTLDSLAQSNGITPMAETKLEEGNIGLINEFRLGASPEKGNHALLNQRSKSYNRMSIVDQDPSDENSQGAFNT